MSDGNRLALANARLIAKAPELLVSARALLLVIEMLPGGTEAEVRFSAPLRKAINDARALLAEIDGQ